MCFKFCMKKKNWLSPSWLALLKLWLELITVKTMILTNPDMQDNLSGQQPARNGVCLSMFVVARHALQSCSEYYKKESQVKKNKE